MYDLPRACAGGYGVYVCAHASTALNVIGGGWVGCSHKAPTKEGDIDTPTWYMDSVAYPFPYIALSAISPNSLVLFDLMPARLLHGIQMWWYQICLMEARHYRERVLVGHGFADGLLDTPAGIRLSRAAYRRFLYTPWHYLYMGGARNGHHLRAQVLHRVQCTADAYIR